jgi:5'-3' exoribonuclease 1
LVGIYGLDADLIMLSLLSHEPHFALLREVVTFGAPRGAKSKADKLHKKDSFQLLYVAILREYFDMEFSHAVKDKLSFEYDVERIIDDFVFRCYLVGNDFLPPLPTIDIRDGGLDDLIAT